MATMAIMYSFAGPLLILIIRAAGGWNFLLSVPTVVSVTSFYLFLFFIDAVAESMCPCCFAPDVVDMQLFGS
jgi:hypothetical protein